MTKISKNKKIKTGNKYKEYATISIKLGDAVNAYLIYIIFDKKLVMKNLLFLLFTFNCAFTFGQTWQDTGIKVIKTGTALTVKWTNESGGVTTQKAVCNIGSSDTEGNTNYICSCATGDYFTFRIYSNDGGCRIQYFNELDSPDMLNGNELIFYVSKKP